jgi:hypothetical protein
VPVNLADRFGHFAGATALAIGGALFLLAPLAHAVWSGVRVVWPAIRKATT